MTTLQHPNTSSTLQLFISYAREDLDAVLMLEEGLETLNHQVWVDRKLTGGQDWWDRILGQIRDCDAMIVAVSPALLDSEAAKLERDYARQLSKPLLPVLVAPLLTDLLPTDLAKVQLVDYTTASPASAYRLAAALTSLPRALLPSQLPPPPPVPVSYLGELADRVRGPSLGLSQQLQLVGELRTALERPRERAAAAQLLQAFEDRRDLYHAAWLEIDPLLRREKQRGEQETGPAISEGAAADVAAGWYPDPSHRHEKRWFDGDWTAFAADSGTVVEDPDF